MPPPAVTSAFDVALWLFDKSSENHEYLQPQKLQRLLFLAQAYYAVVHQGRPLMPAVFLADEMGPVEPNIFLAFSRGRPDVDVMPYLPHSVETLLDSVWRRYGRYPTERLTNLAKQTPAYRDALAKGERTEVTLEAMRRAFASKEESLKPEGPAHGRTLRSQDGRTVQVKAWRPPAAPVKALPSSAEPADG